MANIQTKISHRSANSGAEWVIKGQIRPLSTASQNIFFAVGADAGAPDHPILHAQSIIANAATKIFLRVEEPDPNAMTPPSRP